MPLSDLLKQKAEGYLNLGGPEGQSPVVTSTPDNPIQKQNFSSESNMSRTPPPPAPGAKNTFSPFSSQMVAAAGYLKGIDILQKYEMNARASDREDQKLGMAKADLGMKQQYLTLAQEQMGINLTRATQEQTTFEFKQQEYVGMMEAAKKGGYVGALEFMSSVNPMEAIKMQAEKLELDNNILKNNVAQSMAPVAQANALFDAYARGGQIASTIASAPPEMQSGMYQQALPLIKAINPNAPNEYGEEAIKMGMLMISQGDPSSVARASGAQVGVMQTQRSQAMSQRNLLLQQGKTANDPEIKNLDKSIGELDKQIDTGGMIGQKAELDLANKQLYGMEKRAALVGSFDKRLQTSSAKYIESMGNAAAVSSSIGVAQRELAAGRTPTAALLTIQRQYAKFVSGGGAMSDQDVNSIISDSGYKQLEQGAAAWLRGEKGAMTPQATNQIITLVTAHIANLNEQQLRREAQVKESFDKQGMSEAGLSWDMVSKPSQNYQNMLQTENLDDKQKQGKSQIDQEYQAYISKNPGDKQRADALKQKKYQQLGIPQ